MQIKKDITKKQYLILEETQQFLKATKINQATKQWKDGKAFPDTSCA